MKLGVNDMRVRDHKVTEWILNICINYSNYIKGAHKVWSYFSQEALMLFPLSDSLVVVTD